MQLPDDQIIILDGAVGTELERRGYRTKLPLWSASANHEAPELVRTIHQEYLIAGAQVLTANTFRTSVYTYKKAGLGRQRVRDDLSNARDIGVSAIQLTNKVATLAASIASLEDCYRPDLTPNQSILEDFHEDQVSLIKATGYEHVLVETMHTIREAETIARLCQQYEMDYYLSFIPGSHGQLMSGESILKAIQAINQYNPSAILLNCRPFHTLNHQLTYLKSFDGLKGIYANGTGEPDDEFGWRFDSESPEFEFLENAQTILEQGIQIIGGCCGTRPQDIHKVSAFLNRV